MNTLIKKFSILLIFSMLNIGLYAQYGDQLINRGFEDWTNRDSEPVHWHSNGTATGTWSGLLPDDQIEQSSQTRPGSSGSKSVRMIPKTVWGVTANGNLTNGRMNAGSTSASGSGNYNQTKRSESAYNMPLSMLPDSLTIWVCFRSNSTSTKGQVKAVVHGDADYKIIANGTEDPANMHVATATLSFNRTSSSGGSYTWRRLSIPFNNNGPCTDVRYILMTATTNETPGSGSTSDDLFIDDALLVYNPSLSMGQLASNSFAPGNAITIPFTLSGTMSPDNLNAAANVVIAQMSNASGSFSNPTELGRVTTNTSGSISAQIPAVANGNYQIRVISTNYPMVGTNIQQVTITTPTYNIAATADPSAGGTVSGAGEYNQGASCTLTATANTGYTFTNWTENGSVVSSNASYTFNVTGNRSLVAHFSLNTYNITATANPSAGGTVSGAGQYSHGESCSLTATANTGYTFTNWTENGSVVSTDANYTFTVTANHTLVANFSLNSYNITATANPSAGGSVNGAGEYDYGQSCTLTATANTGYTFTNWTENGAVVSSNANYTFNVTGNRSLVANFTINTYTVTATANPSEGGTVSGAGEYEHGQSCTLTATAAMGYTFTGWRENGIAVSTQADYTFTVTGDRTLVANFSLNAYYITATANPTAGGTVSGAGEYEYGTTCTLTATANNGYTFINWKENGTVVSTSASYSFTVEGDRDLVATFFTNSYTIEATADPSEGGLVDGAGEFDFGMSCTVTATANAGYTFINWTENGSQVSTQATYTFTVEGDRVLVAHFSSQSYIITATADPAEGGVVTGSSGYDFGENCTLTATANPGYTFINWTKDGEVVSTETSFSFTVTETASYVAHFSINNYTISVTAEPNEYGTVSGEGEYEYGASCTLTATANEGYAFVEWTKGGNQVSTNATYSFTVTESASYVAHFQILTYTVSVTVNPSEGGTVIGTGEYEHGATCTLTAMPNENYNFVNWTMDGAEVSTDSILTFTVTESVAYEVHFQYIDNVEENTVACQIFPNPFTSKMSITAEQIIESVSIFDMYGRLLRKQGVSDMHVDLDLSDFSMGHYLIQLDYGDSKSVYRILKVK